MSPTRAVVYVTVGYFALVVTVLGTFIAASYIADAVRHHRNRKPTAEAIAQAAIDHADRMHAEMRERYEMQRLTIVYGADARRKVNQ